MSKHYGEIEKMQRTCRALLIGVIVLCMVLIICFWRMF